MIFQSRTLLLLIFVLLGLLSSGQSFLPLLGESMGGGGSMAECEESAEGCEGGGAGEVCGTDGRTYDSRCEVERARCSGHPVSVAHRGRCTEKGRCEAQRALMLGQQGGSGGLFVPDCLPDGSFAAVQCHRATAYCWCVDEAGKPVQGSSLHNARPNCDTKRKKTNRRRSSRGKKNRKGCGTNDRASFNSNLIDIFQSEFNRVPQTTTTRSPLTSDPLRDTYEKQVIQWKFDQLDGNGDSFLRKKEIRDLRRMAKKIVKPKMCAKTFAKFCDLDQDKRISRSEWSVCVGVDINNEQVNAVAGYLDDSPKEEEAATPEPLPVRSSDHWPSEQHMPRLRHDGHSLKSKPDSEEEEAKEEESGPSCRGARRAALEQRAAVPAAGVFVPACAGGGERWVRAQCHGRVCWCVHPRTGRPVRGAPATHGDSPPDCSARPGPHTNGIKGCSVHKKQEFLDELVQSFIKEMQEDAKNRSQSIDIPTPEKAARWKFASIDTNSNSVLEKREWRGFREAWRSWRDTAGASTSAGASARRGRLRKCWRNLPRFCDENQDQRIAVDEWLACTSVARDFKATASRNPQRKGKNPFSTILKSD